MRPFILITGMHRSGTSFLARALNLHGVYLGKLDSMITHDWLPHKSNLRGHWENQDLLTLADKTLAKNHGSWHNVPKKIVIDKKIGMKIKNHVNELQDHATLAAGFKDPRLLLCYQSWEKYLPKNSVVIGIFRHPLKVAESLKIRSKFSYQHSLKLWKIYNESLLEILSKRDGFLLDFDWPKQKLFSEIALISKKLGLAHNVDLSEWYTKKTYEKWEYFSKRFCSY